MSKSEQLANPGKYRDAKGKSNNSQAKANQRGLDRLKRKQNVRMDWNVWPADAIGRLVTSATEYGYALLFGKTRDGGALTLTIYSDGDKETLYINSAEDAGEVWDSLDSMLAADQNAGAGQVEDVPF